MNIRVSHVAFSEARRRVATTVRSDFDESDQTKIHELAALIGETLDALRAAGLVTMKTAHEEEGARWLRAFATQ